MVRRTSWLTIAALGVVLGTLAACGGNDKAPTASQTTPPPTKTTFTESEWTVVTPAGWTRKVVTAKVDAKKAVRYSSTSGDYFIVAIDPIGSDFNPDTVWRYEVKDFRFEVASKRDCKNSAGVQCPDKDGRYDGYVLWKSGATPQKVGGHTWYFMFGNSKKASVETSVFEQIVESVRVKG